MTTEKPAASTIDSIVVLLVTAATALAAVPASGVAAPALAADPIPTSATIQIPLDLDCSSVPNTPEARTMLRNNGLCGYPKGRGGITTEATIVGNCGTLSLNLFNSGGGWMQWKAEITSSLGPFIAAGYTGSWDNFSGGQGPVNRSYWG